jgi:hypothetical protein
MKRLITICALVLLIAEAPASAYLAEVVDLGTPAGEAGYTLIDWGPVQPTTSGGNWGGLATDSQSLDKLCRTVYAGDDNPWAIIKFPDDEKILWAEIRHLDGIADDSFDVYVGDGTTWNLWGSYTDVGSDEVWKITLFSGTPGNQLKIVATGGSWWGLETYGQLGIDRVIAGVPEPATLLLLGSAGLVGWLRRRRTL